jgi:hypothetical protein
MLTDASLQAYRWLADHAVRVVEFEPRRRPWSDACSRPRRQPTKEHPMDTDRTKVTTPSTSTNLSRPAATEEAVEQREGKVARAIEKQTAKLPSDVFLWAAGAAIVGSAAFQLIGAARGRADQGAAVPAKAPMATFIGMWVPSLLLLGVYNKIVKVAGSDRTER